MPDNETSPAARLAAHALLDLLALWDDETNSVADGAMDLTTERLAEVGAVTALVDDAAPDVAITVDVGPLLTASEFLLEVLLKHAANESGQDRLSVIGHLRDSAEAL